MPSLRRSFAGVRGLLDRLARVSFAFVMMNYAAVAGLVAAVRGRKVWR